jgi:aconitate hydratase
MLDPFGALDTLVIDGRPHAFFSVTRAAAALGDLSRMPRTRRLLLENLLRAASVGAVDPADLRAFVAMAGDGDADQEVTFHPARVLMQDFSGTACLVDLAALRDCLADRGGYPDRVVPRIPVDLVIDHSVMVDHAGTPDAFARNLALDYARNGERYAFLRWGAATFDGLRLVPPGKGICHQINLETLASVVEVRGEARGLPLLIPDSCIGTDSHTTMVNALGVLGWGVGGIEAEAAMLGQPISLLSPRVIGVEVVGRPVEGVLATDLALGLTSILRPYGVVGAFVEFYGPGIAALSLADRATLSNMAPEYGATCAWFPIDLQTLDYLRLTGRAGPHVARVEAYARAQGLWADAATVDPQFDAVVRFDLAAVRPSVAGPLRPQDLVPLDALADSFVGDGKGDDALPEGAVVIAAITSCTNTANPAGMIAAGLLARKARAHGLVAQPWVKTSLSPGSRVVSAYLAAAGLQDDLDALGFNLVGYGCATCVGNSGPLLPRVSASLAQGDRVVAAVLSGNRNFEGRIAPQVRANYLASPPLVVAFALFGTVARDITRDPIGTDLKGAPVYLRDIWPTSREIAATMAAHVAPGPFAACNTSAFDGDDNWQALDVAVARQFPWDPASTSILRPDVIGAAATGAEIRDARVLAILGDSITTDHISPVGAIAADSPAGRYLTEHGLAPADFNSYGARRGNHEVMVRGGFASPRLRNEMVPGREGGVTLYAGEIVPIHDAAQRYRAENAPLVVIAGREYGTGSARDWAAKATAGLGVRVVIAESFERIHRSNLVGMGVLPLQFLPGEGRAVLGITATDRLTITGLDRVEPQGRLIVTATRADGTGYAFTVLCRIDTALERQYFSAGGILPFVAAAL